MTEAYPDLFDRCQPREDVLDGTLQEDQFAASLSAVAHAPDDAPPVYRDANQFFEMTYPTDGLRTLLGNLAGQFLEASDVMETPYSSSILCLDTRFGGGKTHDLIASYHLASDPSDIANLDQIVRGRDEELLAQYRDAASNGLSVDTAVFVGGNVDGQNARSDRNDPNAPNTQTMWGEIAYQLYGLDGYEILKEYDQNRQPPGENALKDLFDRADSPALILIDEIAAYLSAADAVDVGNKTLGDLTLNFMLSLLEAASETEELSVVYSIADTTFEEEAQQAQNLADDLNEIGRRQHKTITPTDDTEVGQVLEYRLFESVSDEAAEEVASAYSRLYQDSSRSVPQAVNSNQYAERLEREYPFHPTVIDTLTEKINSIPTFQRTRGALKLLARAVYHLWNNRPTHYDRHWIRLYDLTPADNAPDGSIDSTLRQSLFEFVDLSAALSADIYDDDETAHAQLEDRKWTEKGIPPLGSHLTTSVLWHSLAYGEQAAGVTRAELNATLAHPDVQFDNYDSALEALAGGNMSVACYFLYDDDRIRFKSKPNLIRIIDQRVQNTPEARARNRFSSRLESEVGTGAFETVMHPESPADLPDELEPQLSVMHMDTTPISDGGDEIPEKITQLYRKTANRLDGDVTNRVYKNYVLFLAPDAERVQSAIDEARQLEAIEELQNDSQQTADLSDDQIDELDRRRQEKYGLLGELVRDAYRHLYYPDQDGLAHIRLDVAAANGDASLVSAVEETLDERLIRAADGAKGVVFFRQKLWQQTQDSMTTEQLLEQFAKKPGLPYLLSPKPLRKTIARMIEQSSYVYWDPTDGDNGAIYWGGSSDEDPDGWDEETAFAEAENVATSIRDTDVAIGSDYVVYETADAFLSVHEDQVVIGGGGTTECAEPGCSRPVSSDGTEQHYCWEHPSDTVRCEECENEVEDHSQLDDEGLCADCRTTQWNEATSVLAASRAFTEVRTTALSRGGDETPGLSRVVISVEGEDKLTKGSFLADRNALTDRSENVSVKMEYEARSEDGDTYRAEYTGGLDGFTRADSQPDQYDSTNTTLKFVVRFGSPEPITDSEDDLLADLDTQLDGINIEVKVEARGPNQTAREATQ